MPSKIASTSNPQLIVPTKNVIVDGVLRYPPTGTKVLIIGAGVGGLMTALECWRKGIEVEIVEKTDVVSGHGDMFGIGPSGWTTLHHYPSMLKEYDEISWDSRMSFQARDGTEVSQEEFEYNREGVETNSAYPLRIKTLMSRYHCAQMLHSQCKRLGIPLTFNVAIEKYEEDITKGNATAVAQDGRRFTADVVIAADGIGTKSHGVTLGRPVRAIKTGFDVYRVMYPTEQLKDAPVAEEMVRNLERPIIMLLQADDLHVISAISKDYIMFGITTKDDDPDATESWSSTVSNETALSKLTEPEKWSPFIREIILHSPENSIVRWSLRFRDPQPQWTSSGGRIVQVGDSAHSFLPSSGNGAVQALEDAASLPECLRLGGKGNEGVATKVHELLRYQRVSLIQHTGFVNMQYVHRDVSKMNPKGNPPMLQGKWLWGHNPEKYATENFAKARSHLENGSPFENTNLPLGHKWSDWTMEDELAKHKAGINTEELLKNNGDWGLY
ncbi:FAD/NAD(P)-binding domain-containing protein [Annulohypoxylon maeteangense]|uniref:FAD/NAD(P)-binding domain-containing protein n=1 Tax=Annulohypoxylon maeteangense TaxID=1927788 RepID=UPI0020075B97|nr:FAD/NAD(P)-binding domain-containing protein [Annulohypoxylon maeteangense]KAI0889816.1 FAD/NAD(P)-binding domain-containing protein [Annulohypoxylon maeteangense]